MHTSPVYTAVYERAQAVTQAVYTLGHTGGEKAGWPAQTSLESAEIG
jgi:hypothetical protein